LLREAARTRDVRRATCAVRLEATGGIFSAA